jgi:hypothetical protein
MIAALEAASAALAAERRWHPQARLMVMKDFIG